MPTSCEHASCLSLEPEFDPERTINIWTQLVPICKPQHSYWEVGGGARRLPGELQASQTGVQSMRDKGDLASKKWKEGTSSSNLCTVLWHVCAHTHKHHLQQ